MPTSTPAGTTGVELIQNGGFEAGLPPWQQSSAGQYDLLSSTKPHSGSQGIWMCGGNNCNDQLWQTVTVPSNVASGTLSYWLNVNTQEPAGSCNDTLTVQIRTTSGAPINQLPAYCSGTPTNGWVQVVADVSGALRQYAGQQVQVFFQGMTNGTLPSSFYLDDVSLLATVLLPTPTLTPSPTPPPTSTPTITPTATATSTPVPSIHITGIDLLRSARGSITQTCDVVLAGNRALIPTRLLAPNQIGLLRVYYQATGPGTPSGQVIYNEKGRPIDGDTLLPGMSGSKPFLCAAVIFTGTQRRHITANATVVLGPASDSQPISFYVGKCYNGTTGNKGACIRCKKNFSLSNGMCVSAHPAPTATRAPAHRPPPPPSPTAPSGPGKGYRRGVVEIDSSLLFREHFPLQRILR